MSWSLVTSPKAKTPWDLEATTGVPANVTSRSSIKPSVLNNFAKVFESNLATGPILLSSVLKKLK